MSQLLEALDKRPNRALFVAAERGGNDGAMQTYECAQTICQQHQWECELVDSLQGLDVQNYKLGVYLGRTEEARQNSKFLGPTLHVELNNKDLLTLELESAILASGEN